MQITIDISLPMDLERALRDETPNLDMDAREAYAIDLYRRKLLTHHQLTKVLGVDRFEVDGVLKKHGVMLEFTAEEFAAELAELRGLVRK